MVGASPALALGVVMPGERAALSYQNGGYECWRPVLCRPWPAQSA